MDKPAINWTESFCVRGIPKEIRWKFKTACAANRTTIRDAIVKLMTTYIERGEK